MTFFNALSYSSDHVYPQVPENSSGFHTIHGRHQKNTLDVQRASLCNFQIYFPATTSSTTDSDTTFVSQLLSGLPPFFFYDLFLTVFLTVYLNSLLSCNSCCRSYDGYISVTHSFPRMNQFKDRFIFFDFFVAVIFSSVCK